MDSKQLLAWADCVPKMQIDSEGCAVPGLPAFIRAADRLVELDVDCDTLLACSQANAFLACSPCLRKLTCTGWCNPNQIPVTVNELHVDYTFWSRVTGHYGPPPLLVEALLYRLAAAPSLQILQLDLAEVPVTSKLSGVQLPALSCLRLSLTISPDLTLSLDWLRSQPVKRLFLILSVTSADAELHKRVVAELRQLSIHSLTLKLHEDIAPHVQHQWASLVGLAFFSMTVAQSMTLVTLPPCKRRSIGATGAAGTCLSVEWAALISSPGTIYFSHGSIDVLNCPGHAPMCDEPWQLRFLKFVKVQGLSAPVTRNEFERVLQNVAADAAGW